jgi:cytochrome c oxidase cbb3-type subunit 4
MFKFIRQYAEKIDGANIFPIIGFIIFFTFFIALLFYVGAMKKEEVNKLSNIPLEGEE